MIKDGIIGTDGSTILAGDDKSGIAAIMEALAVIKEKDLPTEAQTSSLPSEKRAE